MSYLTRCPHCLGYLDATAPAPPTKEERYQARLTLSLVRSGRLDQDSGGFVAFKARLCELATENVAWAAEALRELVETRRAS